LSFFFCSLPLRGGAVTSYVADEPGSAPQPSRATVVHPL